MGSSMEPADITAQLEFMHGANIGGISIVPIYGEVGDENNYVDFLSPKWMENLRYISSECKRLGMGIDMTLGTGWPFGGKTCPSKIPRRNCRIRADAFRQIKK